MKITLFRASFWRAKAGNGSFSGTGTTQVKTESQLPDFSVNAVTMMVEEVYVEAGSTVAEGDALFKIDDESMADAKAYYEDAISDAETALQSAKIDFESGVLEAESELSSTKLAADTAQDTYDTAVSELSVKTSEAQEAYDEAVEEISDYQDAIDNGTYYTQVGINEKQSAVDAAQAALTEKQTQLSDAQSSSQAAKGAYAADMANMKTQIEAGASYTDLAALADQLAADYTAVQEAADALSQSQTEAESANSALQLANQTFQKAVEEYNTKVTEANEKIAELTDELEELSDACDEAERNETTAQPALLQQYVLEGKYADTEYEASLETLQSAVDEAQDTLDELKERQSALLAIEDGVVCADRDGTLASVTYEAGDTLIKNTAFASYYDLDTILISVEVSQNDIAKLAVGDTVQIQISGSRMGAIDGTVYSIASEKTSGGSMSNVTYAVIVAVDNTDGTLTTGVQATVKFETQATGATEMEETKTAGKTETIGASETEEAGGKTE